MSHQGSSFPAGFLWGAATSAFQIEGAPAADGRGESIWDRFAATPGKIRDGSDAAIACDHHRRWREDVALLRDLGVNAYRFSIAWPRVMPLGRGAVNGRGLDFYDRLVDALLEAGIQPFATLYHWDLPQALQEAGGWGARATAAAFAEYARVVGMRLGDRVHRWATHNEPWCVAILGHDQGDQAPGIQDPALALQVAHHVLLSHGWAAQALRRDAPKAEIGIVLNLVPAYPASDDPADREAARRFDGSFNRWYLDPLLRGAYPEDAVADEAQRGHLPGGMTFVQPGDLAAIRAPLDFLGVNYYTRAICRSDGAVAPRTVPEPAAALQDDMGWEPFPDGLEAILLRLHREYGVGKLFVTENGGAWSDGPGPDGRIRDARRIAYLDGHLRAVHRAIAAGAPLAGYFHWSLLDNFEWAHGYTKRFGLHWVDYATQRRIPKDSARWYRDVIAKNALPPAAPVAPEPPRSP